jgi:[ribosomal protein S5]-alanine N-acetyltransferase
MDNVNSSPAATFDFGDFPVLESSRTVLCEYQLGFVEDIFAVRGDAEVQLYNSAPHQSLDETRAFVEEQRAKYRAKTEIIWAIQLRESGRVVGSVSLFDWERYHRRAAIGYDMARDCWGQGLATEAIREVLRFGFEALALNRIEIWTAAENVRSVRLAERLGFERDGTLKRRILEDDGAFHDCAVFGLLRGAWAS